MHGLYCHGTSGLLSVPLPSVKVAKARRDSGIAFGREYDLIPENIGLAPANAVLRILGQHTRSGQTTSE